MLNQANLDRRGHQAKPRQIGPSAATSSSSNAETRFHVCPRFHCCQDLLDDLDDRGLLDSTLVVMAGEFGRTPKVFGLPQHYALPGRDHWGAVQTVFFAGGGVQGGTVVGSSDKIGGHPASDPQKPENMAATIYQALGLPQNATWQDLLDRPMPVYHGKPIAGLS
jgi:hypothetical protein